MIFLLSGTSVLTTRRHILTAGNFRFLRLPFLNLIFQWATQLIFYTKTIILLRTDRYIIGVTMILFDLYVHYDNHR